MDQNDNITIDRAKAYASDTSKIAGAIESMIKSDGWELFKAIWAREKRIILEKQDYTTIEEFKGDRKSLEHFDAILEKFEGYIADAVEAGETLKKLIEDNSQTPNKSVLILDSMEEHGREG